jgi:hypothetical protein
LLARILRQFEWQTEQSHVIAGGRSVDVGVGRDAEVDAVDEMPA